MSQPAASASERVPLLRGRHPHPHPHPHPHLHLQQSPASRRRNVCLILLAVFGSAITISLVSRAIFSELHPHRPPPSSSRLYPAVLARGRYGGVAAENEVCSRIGIDVLRDGGNAVDAATAATLCTGTLNMFSSGIGGGGFMLVRTPNPNPDPDSDSHSSAHANYTTVDFRETAPAAANETMYQGRVHKAQVGGLAVATPGELRGLHVAHQRWGKLPWKRLVMPSVHLARETTVSKELARRLAYFGQFMYHDPAWAEVFVNPLTGRLVQEGDVIRRTAYARTLETVANHGPDAFYHGPVAQSIVSTVQRTGGILTLADLASYRPLVKPAITGTFAGRRVITTPAPTSGPVLVSLLQMLGTFPSLLTAGPTGANMHRFIEALKFAFALRTHVADPAFLHGANASFVDAIPAPSTAERLAARITETTHPLEYYEPLFDIANDHGTMHVSVVDAHGGAVSLTSTVNLIFGSRIMDPHTGVILNDEMDDSSTPGVPNAFGLAPSPFNYPQPHKRPLSSTAPTMLEHPDGQLDLVLGGSGGSRIFGAVAQTILNREWGLDLSAAIEAPRIHHQLLPAYVSAETTFDEHTLNALRGRKHDISYIDINIGVAEVQAVSVQGSGRHRTVYAASDSRKGGIAAAY